jgi:succinyl-CoA synthetase beta subunit
MKIHEYQAKSILKKNGIKVPRGYVVDSVQSSIEAAETLGFPCLVKAQVHAGGRGKSGGIKLVHNEQETVSFVQGILNTSLKTYQNPDGQPVNKLLMEEACDIKKELYLGIVTDRSCNKICIIASLEGGMNIEEIAEKHPEKILKQWVDASIGIKEFHVRNLQYLLKLDETLYSSFRTCVYGLYKIYMDYDVSLLEINPLAITGNNEVLPLDAKIVFDDNAIYRIKDVESLIDNTQEDSKEVLAKSFNLNYITLDGNIGCLVNGAGLAMSTMDIIKHVGGEPANFLDVGGSATESTVEEAFKIILSDKNIKCLLINVFGGIARCDIIAIGIVNAATKINTNIPIVVRLEGTKSEEGREILNNSTLNIVSASSLLDAAKKAFESIK